MPVVNQAVLDALYTGFQTKFNQQFRSTKTFWQQLAAPTMSNAAEEGYPFVEDLGLMKQYFAELPIESVIAQIQRIENLKFGRAFSLKREDIERDKVGLLPTNAASYGEMMAKWPDSLVGRLLRNLFSTEGYDGQDFFDTSHPVGDTLVSNKGTKKLNFSTLAAAQASFGVGKTAMESLVDKDGDPYEISPNLLVVGPDLVDMARSGMTNDRLEDGTNNIYKGACEVLMIRWMNPEEWFLFDTTKTIKPFIFQQELKPEPLPPPTMQSDMWRIQEKAVFGCRARGNAHVFAWQLAWGSDGTVA